MSRLKLLAIWLGVLAAIGLAHTAECLAETSKWLAKVSQWLADQTEKEITKWRNQQS